MAQRVEHLDILVDAQGQAFVLPTFAGGDGIMVALTVTFPSGHANKVGVQVFYSDLQLIPKSAGQFLRGNAQAHRFELENYPTGLGWTMLLVNSDIYDHTVRFDFELDELPATGSAALGFPPIVLVPLDVSLAGSVSQVNADAFASLSGALGSLGAGALPPSPLQSVGSVSPQLDTTLEKSLVDYYEQRAASGQVGTGAPDLFPGG